MAKPGEGDAKTDALFVLGFFVVLFALWIGLGGPQKSEPVPLTFGYPEAPSVASSSETVTAQDAGAIADNNVVATEQETPARTGGLSEGGLLPVALALAIVFLLAARYATGDSGGGGKGSKGGKK